MFDLRERSITSRCFISKYIQIMIEKGDETKISTQFSLENNSQLYRVFVQDSIFFLSLLQKHSMMPDKVLVDCDTKHKLLLLTFCLLLIPLWE